ncbi:F0F1 ATP synthase subunit gamma [bacterium]|nr:F0F1 ATP synthase subunit gamma [bacterium]
MAQLIQMRQRIKAIQTIKKITHAMRLISMSLHSRLRNKAPLLQEYQKEVDIMFEKVRLAAPNWKNPIMHPTDSLETSPMIILIASQKGLCGNFNTSLFKHFEKKVSAETLKNAKIIAIGKHAITYAEKNNISNIIKTFDNISSGKLNTVAHEIIKIISSTKKPYSSITVVANSLKSFFVQQPKTTSLIPLSSSLENTTTMPQEPYTWEQAPNKILDDLSLQYLSAKLYHLLFESTLAEQAARFISMDNSTRNAKQLLEDTQIQYNKLRQTKITSELTELSASFQN